MSTAVLSPAPPRIRRSLRPRVRRRVKRWHAEMTPAERAAAARAARGFRRHLRTLTFEQLKAEHWRQKWLLASEYSVDDFAPGCMLLFHHADRAMRGELWRRWRAARSRVAAA